MNNKAKWGTPLEQFTCLKHFRVDCCSLWFRVAFQIKATPRCYFCYTQDRQTCKNRQQSLGLGTAKSCSNRRYSLSPEINTKGSHFQQGTCRQWHTRYRGRPFHLKAWRDRMPHLQLSGAKWSHPGPSVYFWYSAFEISSPLFLGTPVTHCPQTWALGNLIWISSAPGICTMCIMTLGTKHSFAHLHSCLHYPDIILNDLQQTRGKN